MKRREVLKTVAGAAAATMTVFGAAARAAADEKSPGQPHDKTRDRCARACADCMLECDSCFNHCAQLLAAGKIDHAQTVRLCVDCAELCGAAAKLVSRHSSFTTSTCAACATACDTCAEACEKFPQDAHMAACARSCRTCAKACREMLAHLKP